MGRVFEASCRGRRLQAMRGLCLPLCFFLLGGCDAAQPPAAVASIITSPDDAPGSSKTEESRMWMTVGEQRFAITLNDGAAARALAAQLPLTLDMRELNGNEKYADLPKALPTDESRPGTLRDGDLMLYGSNTLVIFYLTFDSSYSYTRLGQVDDPASLANALGRRGVRVTFSRN